MIRALFLLPHFFIASLVRIETKLFGILDTAAGRGWAHCGAVTVVKAAADTAVFQHGVELDEGGLNTESVEVEYSLEVNNRVPDIKGETRVRMRSTKVSRSITIQGEVIGALTAYPLNTGATIANDMNTIGDGTGLILCDTWTESQKRTGDRSIAIKLSSNPGLVA